MEGWRDGAGHDNTHQLDRGGGYNWHNHDFAGIILCMRLANERRRYTVTSSPIGWAQLAGRMHKTIPDLVLISLTRIYSKSIFIRT